MIDQPGETPRPSDARTQLIECIRQELAIHRQLWTDEQWPLRTYTGTLKLTEMEIILDALDASRAALTAEREACAAIAEAEAERCVERMATADQQQDIKTADMLEAQSVAAYRIQQAIEARGDHPSPTTQDADQG